MSTSKRWTLGAKIALAAAPFLLLSLVAIGLTLWVSWQLDGGAAAVNEAGRMRMQAYRLSLSIATGDRAALPGQLAAFERSLELLRRGDAERPLFLPRDDAVRVAFAAAEAEWQRLADRWGAAAPAALIPEVERFVARLDALVGLIEGHLSRWMALQHLLQTAVLLLAVTGGATLLIAGYRFVLEPVQQLKLAIERLQGGDFGARVNEIGNDEFGTLATGFNDLAAHLQSMYRNLEARVAEKTAELHDKRERLEALYDVTTLIARATSLEELADGFCQRIALVAHADGAALRWCDERNERYVLLASHGLPASLAGNEAERCLDAGRCACGLPEAPAGARIIAIHALPAGRLPHCARAGFETIVALPIRLHERTMGEVELFYSAQVHPSEAERSLLDALIAHLATAMENLRLDGLAREAAISEERNFLARELHDSIAQSLAFLKIEVQLMRDALASGDPRQVKTVLDEIDEGVRESYADVRELLVHFRTRTSGEQIEQALQTTLRKFEHQSGLRASLQMHDRGMPLPPDTQIQVLHIIQEALSNVRKHAHANQVWLEVRQQPQWRFEIRDDGSGFEPGLHGPDAPHVGLRIMAERAERLGATLHVDSVPGCGTAVVLELRTPPGTAAGSGPAAPAAAATLTAARP